jgi:hypothetical protein
MTSKTNSKWRSKFRVHPAADKLPRMTDAELRALSEDIRTNGLSATIDCRLIGKEREILDGRHRLDALEMAGIAPRPNAFRELELDDAAAVLHIMSMNVHRRHLNAEQKRQVIAELLKADPAKSDRQLGKIAKADHKTVAAQRDRMEATGEIPQVTERAGADGKTRKAKPAAEKQFYRRPLPHKPELKTQHPGLFNARRVHVKEAINVRVDPETEIEQFADDIREAFRNVGADGEDTAPTATSGNGRMR